MKTLTLEDTHVVSGGACEHDDQCSTPDKLNEFIDDSIDRIEEGADDFHDRIHDISNHDDIKKSLFSFCYLK